ncbi:uncharacterized protein YgbK (DUF1537 family) [Kribbella amoyensis]|uniref:Uncharacterized protein YgbK (DUF1537 family) n=1 Tax=Kribbella amoyensis TaxID=996641 RepID=A0A561B8J1_9ACTN|nr:four-carbon acid sugar kinase family protein [Kribbella amoyensis]TWD75173.1 uncharacterized protein YgbK (DUF1537 family) [Kribbella amoyensis]
MVEAAFYGDDFTGSTDALLQYERLGLHGALLVELPPLDELRKLAAQYDVIGVAGIARSLPPDEQEAEIRPILSALRELDPRVVQYKICSTADSSPVLGSLGRALEVGRSLFGPAPVPVLAAQPELGRYTVFGHHFAAEAGVVHRLDRQPTMANHPATPMHESDLRRHLAAQTDLRITSLELTGYGELGARYAEIDGDVVVLDALTDADLVAVGRAVLAGGNGGPLFAMGSGGLSRALGTALTDGGRRSGVVRHGVGDSAPEQVLVVSGSQSRRTAEQIELAVRAGWTSLTLDADAAHLAVEALRAGAPGVVVHTGRADGVPGAVGHTSGLPGSGAHAAGGIGAGVLPLLAEGLAEVVRAVAQGTEVRKVIVAGGDTSGRVLRELDITAVELATDPTQDQDGFGPGVVLCRTLAADPWLDGLLVILKGGQVGSVELFEVLRVS